MAEKLNSNITLKYYQYPNLKGIILVKGKTKAVVVSSEATRGRFKQNITNTRFFKAIK